MGRLWSTGTLRSAAESQECADARESTPATTATKLAHVHPEISRALKMHQPGGTKHRPHQIGVVVPPAVPPISPGWMGACIHAIGHQSLIYQRKRAFAEFRRTPLDVMVVELAGAKPRVFPYLKNHCFQRLRAGLQNSTTFGTSRALKSVPPKCIPRCAPCAGHKAQDSRTWVQGRNNTEP